MKKPNGSKLKKDAGNPDSKIVNTVEVRKEVGRKIQEIRKRLGFSARKMAEVLDISREAFTQIETGRNNINAVSLWKLACRLGCRIDDFFPPVPEGFTLTKADVGFVAKEGGKKAVEWAKALFGEEK